MRELELMRGEQPRVHAGHDELLLLRRATATEASSCVRPDEPFLMNVYNAER